MSVVPGIHDPVVSVLLQVFVVYRCPVKVTRCGEEDMSLTLEALGGQSHDALGLNSSKP